MQRFRSLDEKIKEIRLKNAIEQQFAGSGGVFRQMNIEKRRVYNLPQWRAVCESTDHQPPARRGEVRMAGHTVGKRKARAKSQKPARKKANRGRTKTVAITSSPWIAWSADQIAVEEASAHQGKHCISCNQVPDVPGWINQSTGDILCNTCRIDDNRDTTTSDPQHVADDQPTEQVAHVPSRRATLRQPHNALRRRQRRINISRAIRRDGPCHRRINNNRSSHNTPPATNSKTKTVRVDRRRCRRTRSRL